MPVYLIIWSSNDARERYRYKKKTTNPGAKRNKRSVGAVAITPRLPGELLMTTYAEKQVEIDQSGLKLTPP